MWLWRIGKEAHCPLHASLPSRRRCVTWITLNSDTTIATAMSAPTKMTPIVITTVRPSARENANCVPLPYTKSYSRSWARTAGYGSPAQHKCERRACGPAALATALPSVTPGLAPVHNPTHPPPAVSSTPVGPLTREPRAAVQARPRLLQYEGAEEHSDRHDGRQRADHSDGGVLPRAMPSLRIEKGAVRALPDNKCQAIQEAAVWTKRIM